jgi:hypothetical protein
MIIIHDRASAALALERNLEPPIRAALEAELALLTGGEHNLTDQTAILTVEPFDTVADVAHEAGLPTPLAGWDHLSCRGGVWRMVVTYGSTFATIILIPGDADPALLNLIQEKSK